MKLNFFCLPFDNHEKKLYLIANSSATSCLYTILLFEKIDYVSKLKINILGKN